MTTMTIKWSLKKHIIYLSILFKAARHLRNQQVNNQKFQEKSAHFIKSVECQIPSFEIHIHPNGAYRNPLSIPIPFKATSRLKKQQVDYQNSKKQQLPTSKKSGMSNPFD